MNALRLATTTTVFIYFVYKKNVITLLQNYIGNRKPLSDSTTD